MLFVSMFLVLVPLISDPKAEYMFAIGFILLGCIVYVPVIWKKHYLPGMGKWETLVTYTTIDNTHIMIWVYFTVQQTLINIHYLHILHDVLQPTV